ncbi:hypothetical protein IB260_00340 [Pseudomonas sp. PDM23]|uniref:hypothetical protein n=1 Tax=unclassified Pseudomonas TaxID=196821 RepID=UPI0017869953|nr:MULTISPECIES: hypothetical protein [unclassified Pseudomonas]MBD9573743.1 hypothetical protein [Pseudomonas sp. PDM23]MBD9671579.1 hypothetical protein [Pseudomonas sp. PDM21]
MSLMYTIKAIKRDGERYCHPCEGAYRVVWSEQSCDSDPGVATIYDVEKGIHFSMADYNAIYIENANGQTIDHFRAKPSQGMPSCGIAE